MYHRHTREIVSIEQTIDDIANGVERYAYCPICKCVPTRSYGKDVDETRMDVARPAG
jgi:hypothetical protein